MNTFVRRSAFRSSLLGLLVLVAPWARGTDWPQYRGPNFNGTSSEKIQKSWPDAGPRQIWKTPLNAGFSSFAVAGNRAYTLVLREINGVKNEVCIALESDTGKEVWMAELGYAKYDGGGDSGAPANNGGDGPRSTPSVDGNRVYVLSAGLVLSAFGTADGKLAWRKELMKEYGARNISWQNAASPVIEGNLIFVCAGGEGQSLLCFDKRSGALVWKNQSDKMTHATPVVTTLLGHRQVIFFTQSGLVSVVPGTGTVLWRYAFPYKVSTAASPVVGGDIVYCSAGYGVGAAAVRVAKEGSAFKVTELWRKENKLVNHWSTSVYHEGHIYGLFGFKQWERVPLKCVELATGEEKWSEDGYGQGGIIVADGHIIALAENGDLVLVEATPKGYKEKARTKAVTGKCWNNVALANGRIYARSTKEGVCLDLSARTTQR